jgi:hypothetical protein
MPPILSPESILIPFPVPTGLLGATMRRKLAELNREYLDLCMSPGAAGDGRFGLREDVLDKLAGADPDTLRRLVHCPFALFELYIEPASRFEASRQVSDSALQSTEPFEESGQRFIQAAVVAVAHMTERSTLATRIAFGLSPAVDALVRDLSPVALLLAAARRTSLRPRWRDHPIFWPTLLEGAQLKGGLVLQRAHSLGIRLLAAQVATFPRSPHRR